MFFDSIFNSLYKTEETVRETYGNTEDAPDEFKKGVFKNVFKNMYNMPEVAHISTQNDDYLKDGVEDGALSLEEIREADPTYSTIQDKYVKEEKKEELGTPQEQRMVAINNAIKVIPKTFLNTPELALQATVDTGITAVKGVQDLMVTGVRLANNATYRNKDIDRWLDDGQKYIDNAERWLKSNLTPDWNKVTEDGVGKVVKDLVNVIASTRATVGIANRLGLGDTALKIGAFFGLTGGAKDLSDATSIKKKEFEERLKSFGKWGVKQLGGIAMTTLPEKAVRVMSGKSQYFNEAIGNVIPTLIFPAIGMVEEGGNSLIENRKFNYTFERGAFDIATGIALSATPHSSKVKKNITDKFAEKLNEIDVDYFKKNELDRDSRNIIAESIVEGRETSKDSTPFTDLKIIYETGNMDKKQFNKVLDTINVIKDSINKNTKGVKITENDVLSHVFKIDRIKINTSENIQEALGLPKEKADGVFVYDRELGSNTIFFEKNPIASKVWHEVVHPHDTTYMPKKNADGTLRPEIIPKMAENIIEGKRDSSKINVPENINEAREYETLMGTFFGEPVSINKTMTNATLGGKGRTSRDMDTVNQTNKSINDVGKAIESEIISNTENGKVTDSTTLKARTFHIYEKAHNNTLTKKDITNYIKSVEEITTKENVDLAKEVYENNNNFLFGSEVTKLRHQSELQRSLVDIFKKISGVDIFKDGVLKTNKEFTDSIRKDLKHIKENADELLREDKQHTPEFDVYYSERTEQNKRRTELLKGSKEQVEETTRLAEELDNKRDLLFREENIEGAIGKTKFKRTAKEKAEIRDILKEQVDNIYESTQPEIFTKKMEKLIKDVSRKADSAFEINNLDLMYQVLSDKMYKSEVIRETDINILNKIEHLIDPSASSAGYKLNTVKGFYKTKEASDVILGINTGTNLLKKAQREIDVFYNTTKNRMFTKKESTVKDNFKNNYKTLEKEAIRIDKMESGLEKNIAYEKFAVDVYKYVPELIGHKVRNYIIAGLLLHTDVITNNVVNNIGFGVLDKVSHQTWGRVVENIMDIKLKAGGKYKTTEPIKDMLNIRKKVKHFGDRSMKTLSKTSEDIKNRLLRKGGEQQLGADVAKFIGLDGVNMLNKITDNNSSRMIQSVDKYDASNLANRYRGSKLRRGVNSVLEFTLAMPDKLSFYNNYVYELQQRKSRYEYINKDKKFSKQELEKLEKDKTNTDSFFKDYSMLTTQQKVDAFISAKEKTVQDFNYLTKVTTGMIEMTKKKSDEYLMGFNLPEYVASMFFIKTGANMGMRGYEYNPVNLIRNVAKLKNFVKDKKSFDKLDKMNVELDDTVKLGDAFSKKVKKKIINEYKRKFGDKEYEQAIRYIDKENILELQTTSRNTGRGLTGTAIVGWAIHAYLNGTLSDEADYTTAKGRYNLQKAKKPLSYTVDLPLIGKVDIDVTDLGEILKPIIRGGIAVGKSLKENREVLRTIGFKDDIAVLIKGLAKGFEKSVSASIETIAGAGIRNVAKMKGEFSNVGKWLLLEGAKLSNWRFARDVVSGTESKQSFDKGDADKTFKNRLKGSIIGVKNTLPAKFDRKGETIHNKRNVYVKDYVRLSKTNKTEDFTEFLLDELNDYNYRIKNSLTDEQKKRYKPDYKVADILIQNLSGKDFIQEVKVNDNIVKFRDSVPEEVLQEIQKTYWDIYSEELKWLEEKVRANKSLDITKVFDRIKKVKSAVLSNIDELFEKYYEDENLDYIKNDRNILNDIDSIRDFKIK